MWFVPHITQELINVSLGSSFERANSLTGRCVQCGNWKFHVNQLQILTESVQGDTSIRGCKERSFGTAIVILIIQKIQPCVLPQDCVEQSRMESLSGLRNHGNDKLPGMD